MWVSSTHRMWVDVILVKSLRVLAFTFVLFQVVIRSGMTRERKISKPKQTLKHTQPSSVQFSHSVMSNSLQPHELQHARPPYPSPTPRVYSNSYLLSQWSPTISSSVVPFSSRLQSFPASGSFQVSQFFASGGQKYWSFIFSISPSNEHSGLIFFRMDWLDLIAMQGTLKSLL